MKNLINSILKNPKGTLKEVLEMGENKVYYNHSYRNEKNKVSTIINFYTIIGKEKFIIDASIKLILKDEITVIPTGIIIKGVKYPEIIERIIKSLSLTVYGNPDTIKLIWEDI